jgi:hypothetical protein
VQVPVHLDQLDQHGGVLREGVEQATDVERHGRDTRTAGVQ